MIRARTLGLAPLLLLACEPDGAPSRVPGSTDAPALSVPYPVADPERIEGAGRQALADARFVFIALGATPEDRDHALPERFTADGPVLVAHHVEPVGSTTASWQKLRRLGFGRVEPERGIAVPVPAPELEALELTPPAETVWLIGPRGTCRATTGQPVVAAYDGRDDTVMVGYRLEGCEGRQWAQVGIIADTIPVDFRWIAAESSPELTLAHGKPWDDPLAPLVEQAAWSDGHTPRFDLVQLREIPEADPRVVQVHHAVLDMLPAENPGSWCELEMEWTRTDGWSNGRWIDPIPWPAEATGPFMLGAFVNGTQVDAVIYEDRFEGLVMIPPGPLDDVDDPDAWRREFVFTGHFPEGRLQQWGVHPARGPLPVGPSCELTGADDR